MQRLFKKNKAKAKKNSIKHLSFYPIEIVEYEIVDEYTFEESENPEVFFVKSGNFLHESKSGKQSLGEGSIIISHPGNIHSISMPNNVKITKIKFLPEWFSSEFMFILSSSGLFQLFFVYSTYSFKPEISLFTLNTSKQSFIELTNELNFLTRLLVENNQDQSLIRLSCLKLLYYISHQYENYWRGHNYTNLDQDILESLKIIETLIVRGEPFKLGTLEKYITKSIDRFSRNFRKKTGMALIDYTQKRRINLSASYLLLSNMSVSKIARRFNYSDNAHFTKSFNKFFNLSPIKYREKYNIKITHS